MSALLFRRLRVQPARLSRWCRRPAQGKLIGWASTGQELLTTTEVAHALRATDQTIRNWIEHGRLEAVRVGRRYLIPRSELTRLQADQGISAGESAWDHTQPPVPLMRSGAASGWVD